MKNMTIYQSTAADNLFQPVDYQVSNNEAEAVIAIAPKETYQTIDGFGASFTDSSAYLIDQVLDGNDKESLMTKLFDLEEGIGLSVIRNPMGASDYARTIYSYDDQPAGQVDPELKDFSIAHDLESILPLTKWAGDINPDLQVFASPWSPPGWMKTSGIMNGGKLKEEYYEAYANYFVKFIQAYQERGIKINAITPQNEALFMPLHYPSMEFLAHEEGHFIKNYLKPAFEANQLATKILAYDHNWDRIDYAFDVMDLAGDAVDGMAWHWYGGRPISQSRVQKEYPEMETHFTEGSGGEWIPEFEPAFSNVMRTGIEVMRNYSKTFILWNLALDENNGPTVPGFGKSTCRGLVKINQETKELTYTLDYYALAHFSKFLKHGAKCIGTTEHHIIKNVAFLNTDGSIVCVLFNDSETTQTVSLEITEQGAKTIDIPQKSAMTLVFE
ncbi:glycoside hydrolase family 30 protein [Vagococcus salmoninarum]|uniref:glycoside hydrolase family 30 protein n=1 Tax=Vagococcus salmoninarum TaxID=2739 RepID=UPI0028D2DA9C|nr:glycoside hydrolase family 30 beta sandwich domain-containing protein [Vagococcus salmoninarum]